MAIIMKVFRTCSLLFYCALCVCGFPKEPVEPWIVSFSVDAKRCEQTICKYWLSVHGGPFLGYYSWRLTPEPGPRGTECGPYVSDFEFKATQTFESSSNVEITVVDSERRIYFCLHHSLNNNSPIAGKWIHQGSKLFLDPTRDLLHKLYPASTLETQTLNLERSANITDLTHDIDVNYIQTPKPEEFEENDIEVFKNDKYVPLKNINKDVNNANNYKNTNTQDDNLNIELINKVDFKPNDHNLIRKKRHLSHNDNITHPIISLDANIKIDNVTKENTTADRFLVSPEDIFEARKDINYIKPTNHEEKHQDALIKIREKRQTMPFDVASAKPGLEKIKLEGIRVEDSDKEQRVLDSKPSVFANSKLTLRLFGQGLTTKTVIAFTDVKSEYGQPCKYLLKGEYKLTADSINGHTALVDVRAPANTHNSLYICAKTFKSDKEDDEKYIHQGSEPWLVLSTYDKFLPLWLQIMFIIICLCFSALFSGLNLGLMSLDKTELKIISNTGTPQEQKYARSIMPVRDHGNYLLCSILLGNVAVNSTLTLLLDDLTSGLFAVIFATLLIVMLGEITPQAICSRHGLKVGAKTIIITKAVMALQAPLAYPISKLLDYFLGEEIGNVYNRERLKELVKVTTDMNDLDKYEVNIISGALELRKKTVADIMTKIEDVFMLPITSILDFETMNEIINSGFSRIPVYEGTRANIITVLFVKDLAFVDPDDNTPLKTLCQYYQNPCNFVFEDVTLDVMFRQFKEGSKGHMAFVHRVNDQGDTDPFYEVVGLLTLEDVIEELIQAEILDETDVYTDNTNHRRRRMRPSKLQDFSAFAKRRDNKQVNISPQLTLATFQFLSTSVDEFRPEVISETVLRRLLKQDIIHHIKVKGKNKKDPSTYVFQAGKPVDYFVLILEGRVEVTVGREKLVFEAGPFTYFGVQALAPNVGMQPSSHSSIPADSSPTISSKGSLTNINMDSMLRHSFLPDYSVRAVTELYYLTVRRSLYLAAKKATLMEQSALSKGTTHEQFDTEVDKTKKDSSPSPSSLQVDYNKLLEGVNEDLSESGENKTPSRQVSPNPQTIKLSPTFRERNSDMFPAPPPDEHEKLLNHQTTPSTYRYDERSQLNCGVFD